MTNPAEWPGASDPKLTPGELLALILSTVEATFEQAEIELPERRYYTTGGIVADCEQLTIHMNQLYKGVPGQDPNETQRCNSPRSMVTTIVLYRAYPVTNTRTGPTPEMHMSNADRITQDTWVLLDCLDAIDAVGWGTGVLGEVTVQEPTGGLIGVALNCVLPCP